MFSKGISISIKMLLLTIIMVIKMVIIDIIVMNVEYFFIKI